MVPFLVSKTPVTEIMSKFWGIKNFLQGYTWYLSIIILTKVYGPDTKNVVNGKKYTVFWLPKFIGSTTSSFYCIHVLPFYVWPNKSKRKWYLRLKLTMTVYFLFMTVYLRWYIPRILFIQNLFWIVYNIRYIPILLWKTMLITIMWNLPQRSGPSEIFHIQEFLISCGSKVDESNNQKLERAYFDLCYRTSLWRAVHLVDIN